MIVSSQQYESIKMKHQYQQVENYTKLQILQSFYYYGGYGNMRCGFPLFSPNFGVCGGICDFFGSSTPRVFECTVRFKNSAANNATLFSIRLAVLCRHSSIRNNFNSNATIDCASIWKSDLSQLQLPSSIFIRSDIHSCELH